MNCPRCGNEIVNEDLSFCPQCGVFLAAFNMKVQDLPTTRMSANPGGFLSLGSLLGERYLLIEQIGKGGMGFVYKAKDMELDEVVALKVLKPNLAADTEMLFRFKNEIKVARRIKHPNVCSIFNFGTVNGIFFISMAYIEGITLASLIRREIICTDRRLSLVPGILSALQATHCEQLVHRDLKPGNIMITKDFEPIIVDFGVARYLGSTDVTAPEEIFGTPFYMAPENFLGLPVDHRSDIYSMGIILFELFTREVPFKGDTPLVIARHHIEETVPSMRDLVPDLPLRYETIIRKCLAKDPLKRFQTVEQLAGAWSGESVQDVPTSPLSRLPSILVVDDDPSYREFFGDMLLEQGYQVFFACNGEEAIEKAIRELPTVICMDLMMPGIDGCQAADILKHTPETRSIPIIMVTCREDREYRAFGKSVGILEYITKPFNVDEFCALLNRIAPIKQ